MLDPCKCCGNHSERPGWLQQDGHWRLSLKQEEALGEEQEERRLSDGPLQAEQAHERRRGAREGAEGWACGEIILLPQKDTLNGLEPGQVQGRASSTGCAHYTMSNWHK